MTINLSRRGLFRLRTKTTVAFRPPWSVEESLFIENCQRCNACIDSCETQLLKRGDGGYPEADFSGAALSGAECTFCAACVNACIYNAFQYDAERAPWQIKAHISDNCLAKQHIDCRACADTCDPEAIRFQPVLNTVAQPLLDTDSCTGCGACVAQCLNQAITMLHPEQSSAGYTMNE